MRTVTVALPDGRTYDALIGRGVRHELAGVVPSGVKRVAIVTQASIAALAPFADLDPGCEHRTCVIGEGEDHKSLSTVEGLCREWSQWGLTRSDAVVAVGGGLATDVGGFAASVYHRGIPVIYVATTLLGMIDAAIGGKTGVNLPEGKNLVGAFWQPSAVLMDLDFLDTLPPREHRCGLGELAKYHFLVGAERPPLDELSLEDRVARCVEIKAAVVAADEREGAGGQRATLNYGHTLAHALEVAERFDLRHGEAVAIGLVFAAELARALGRIDEARVAEHRAIVSRYELPSTIPSGCRPDELVELMGRDKKAMAGLTFVLDGPRGVETVTGVPRAAIDEALAALT